jgi:hypothetical protein
MTDVSLDPLSLPIVPPMDLNASMPGIDRISPFPMRLRTRSGVGLFETRRGVANGLVRVHEGVDLLAPIGTKVFAAANGVVIQAGANSLLIQHDNGFRFLTFYTHLQNKIVAPPVPVAAGQQIAEVGDFPDSSEDHLHFEIRYPFDSSNPSYADSLPVDPTMVLFGWEEKTFQNDEEVRKGHIFDNVYISSFEEVRRARLLRFLLVNVDNSSRDLFIPLLSTTPFIEGMIVSIKQALFASKKVRIVWRESLFFRNIQTEHDRASIIAEVKVYR